MMMIMISHLRTAPEVKTVERLSCKLSVPEHQVYLVNMVNMVNIVNMVIIHLVIDSGSWQPGSSNMVSENSTPGLSGPEDNHSN